MLLTWGCSQQNNPVSIDEGLLKAPAQGETAALYKSSYTFPELIPLPAGFAPEGIATGRGTSFFVGSLVNGEIFKGDLRSGAGEILVQGMSGNIAVGLHVDQRSNYLYVAGGRNGDARVYNADTGELLAAYTLAPTPGAFVNDVVVTRDAAYFTNSFQSIIYKLPLGPGGTLPDPGEVITLALSANYETAPGFNTNGIDATPDGKQLIIVNSTTGKLYTVDPETGDVSEINLHGDLVRAGDGILLSGKNLYVMQNRLNQIAVVALSPDYSAGKVVDLLTDPAFDIPTTIAEHGNYLYAVNAKFGTPPPGTAYEVVQVKK